MRTKRRGRIGAVSDEVRLGRRAAPNRRLRIGPPACPRTGRDSAMEVPNSWARHTEIASHRAEARRPARNAACEPRQRAPSPLEEHVGRLDESSLDLERREEVLRDSRASLERLLRLGANDLDAREAELAERLRELDVRERHMAAEEIELDRRRGELGAVELRRASHRAPRAGPRRARGRARRARGPSAPPYPMTTATLPSSRSSRERRYGLVELENGAGSGVGTQLELDGVEYVVARIGPSPLPADPRRCAYLMRVREPERS